MAATKMTYKKPDKGFKALDAISEAYTKFLHVAYPTTKDITEEIEKAIPEFVKTAKKRVEDLLDIIRELRWETEEARKALEVANKKLHVVLRDQIAGDPSTWLAGEEHKAVTSKPAKGEMKVDRSPNLPVKGGQEGR